MTVLHCTELIWTLLSPCEKSSRRTQVCTRCYSCIWNSTRGCLRSSKLCIIYNIELRVCPDKKTALQEHLMTSLIPAIQEISTIALLHGCWCLLPVWSGVQKVKLLKSSDLGGFSAQSRIHYLLVNGLIWYTVYPATVARCAFGDQVRLKMWLKERMHRSLDCGDIEQG